MKAHWLNSRAFDLANVSKGPHSGR